MYLNEIPYGRNAYGVQAAAQSYFGKTANTLDLAESAYLAALPQAPTYYNPLGPNRQALDDRKNTILSLMKDQGYITADQMKQAQNEKVDFSPLSNIMVAPHFVLYVENYLANKYGESTLNEGGLKSIPRLIPDSKASRNRWLRTTRTKNKKNTRSATPPWWPLTPKPDKF